MALTNNAPSIEHYRIHAYVCGQACVREMDMMGTVSFGWVFTNRPDDCRYAVLSHYDVATHADVVEVYDLFAAGFSRATGLVPPAPIRICDNVDTAIMATSMLYEEE